LVLCGVSDEGVGEETGAVLLEDNGPELDSLRDARLTSVSVSVLSRMSAMILRTGEGEVEAYKERA